MTRTLTPSRLDDLSHDIIALQRHLPSGYTIEAAVLDRQSTYVIMGRRRTISGMSYATWIADAGGPMVSGHYDLKTRREALRDMCERLALHV